MFKVEDFQNYGKEHFETYVASATSVQHGLQAIASAYGDYTKKSFEDTKSFVEKLSGVKSLDKAMEAQTDFARSAYETFVAEFAEDRRPLQRPRQAGVQAGRDGRVEVHPGRPVILPKASGIRKSPAGSAGLFLRVAARQEVGHEVPGTGGVVPLVMLGTKLVWRGYR